MSMSINKLEERKEGLFITSRRPFKPLGTFKEDTISKTLNFAFAMSFGEAGEHRDHRSGGSHFRKPGEVFANAFQGKLSEFALYNLLYKDYPLESPDLSTYGLGKWDDFDFVINNKHISIKSTKSFGNLLLLETNDWNNSAEYIPNVEKNKAVYDFFVLVRIEPNCESILKKLKALYSNTANRNILGKTIITHRWSYDIPGFITIAELRYIIAYKYIIKKGAMLNGNTIMDATNYYCQAGDLHPISNFKIHLE